MSDKQTFVTRSAFAASMQQDETEREFSYIGDQLFDGEDLIDRVYVSFVHLIAGGGWLTENPTFAPDINDIGLVYQNGLYIPCEKRVVFSGFVQMDVDPIPDYCGTITDHDIGHGSTTQSVSVSKARIPKGWIAPCQGTQIRVTIMTRDKSMTRQDKKILDGNADYLGAFTFPAVIKSNGEIIPAVNNRFRVEGKMVSTWAKFCWAAIKTINAWSDKRNLWQVKTAESLLSSDRKTPLTLGVSSEHIKSLFYSRQAPLTMSGRKRPILHWVESHKRRLKEGIDIDIEKHLRGITGFEMDGFTFEITDPIKQTLIKTRGLAA